MSPNEKSGLSTLHPIMDSEKVHEKSRNSLWEAFITPREPKEKPKSRDPSISPRETKETNSHEARSFYFSFLFIFSILFAGEAVLAVATTVRRMELRRLR